MRTVPASALQAACAAAKLSLPFTHATLHLHCAANYLEVADIDTITTTGGGATANSFTDGLTLPDGTFLPLNQVRCVDVPCFLNRVIG